MAQAKIGKPVPAISLEATGDQKIELAQLKGNNIVLYFYPKDNTSGCTTEGTDFRDNHSEFKRLKTIILGVSRDSVRSHENFKKKYNFPFDLLSDPEEELCKAFAVIKEKNMYGKKYMGIERSTFIIDNKGVLRQEFRKVKVKGHIEELLEAIKGL
ncbi:MAG: peroxiredoxin [Gammaproteobacteria bacterium]|nr:peroxiredoxin [Gammaproteobacteria bacterium]